MVSSGPTLDKPRPQLSDLLPNHCMDLETGKIAIQSFWTQDARTMGSTEYQLMNKEVGTCRLNCSREQQTSSS